MRHYTIYEQQMIKQLVRWERELLEPESLLQKTSKSMQNRINKALPAQVHRLITSTVKGIMHTALFSAEYMPKQPPLTEASLAIRDHRAEQRIPFYKKLAAAEGAGTGAGGILLGLADFPILIGIKMKFLFELAHLYGHSTANPQERLFILHVFQLAYCSQPKRASLLKTIKYWPSEAEQDQTIDNISVNWEQLQQEYRDTLDLRKLLQLLPGIGAVVGAWANYGLLDQLGHTAMNCYRQRWLQSTDKK